MMDGVFCAGVQGGRLEDFHEHNARQFLLHELRVQQLERQTAAALNLRSGPLEAKRGTKRRVVCLSELNPRTGTWPVFATCTRAGQSIGQKADNICTAIRRLARHGSGSAGGKLWAYEGTYSADRVNELPAGAVRPIEPRATTQNLNPRGHDDEQQQHADRGTQPKRHDPAGPGDGTRRPGQLQRCAA